VIDEVDASFGANASERNGPQITSFNQRQYMAYWNLSANLVVIQRDLVSEEITYHVLTDVTIRKKDMHFAPAIALDETGRILLCYNSHGRKVVWRYSANTEDITSWSDERTGMTADDGRNAGNPMFINGGDTGRPLLFLYWRRAEIGALPRVRVNRWDAAQQAWVVHVPVLIDGAGFPNKRSYIWSPPHTEDGTIHLFWNWHTDGEGADHHSDLMYARSPDGGGVWGRADGTSYTLPIKPESAEVVATVPVRSGMDNSGYGAVDPDGHPHAAYTRFDARGVSQVHHAWFDGSTWHSEKVTNRRLVATVSGASSSANRHRRPISRPAMEIYRDGTALIFMRDYEFGNALISYERRPGGKWTPWRTGEENLLGWGPKWDRARFQETGQINLIMASVSDANGSPMLAHSTPLSIWEFGDINEFRTSYPPAIKVVATASRSGAEPALQTVSTEYVDVGPRISSGFAAFDQMPTHARFVVENYPAAALSVRLSAAKFSPDAVESLVSQHFGECTRTHPSAGVIDSGWVHIPVFTTELGQNLFDHGFVGMQLKSNDGSVAVVRHWTLMLGTKAEIPDSVGLGTS
jgi:hypothetical protein